MDFESEPQQWSQALLAHVLLKWACNSQNNHRHWSAGASQTDYGALWHHGANHPSSTAHKVCGYWRHCQLVLRSLEGYLPVRRCRATNRHWHRVPLVSASLHPCCQDLHEHQHVKCKKAALHSAAIGRANGPSLIEMNLTSDLVAGSCLKFCLQISLGSQIKFRKVGM